MKEYFISKLSFREAEKLIDTVFVYEYDKNTLSSGESKDRNWLVEKHSLGYKISTIYPNSEKKNWNRGEVISYNNNLFGWDRHLPQNITRHKTFVSYYHHDDQYYKGRFENLFGDLIIQKSVQDGDIDSDNSDEYVKQLIQKGYLADTTVLIVLVGINTKHRMHVDWEISGALNYKVGDKYAGILALKLPTHPDFGTGKYTYSNLPDRLADNLKSGYAKIYDWTEDRVDIQKYIEEAYERRSVATDKRENIRLQMTKNTNE